MPWNPLSPGSSVQQDTDVAAQNRVKPGAVVVSGNQQKYRREFNDPTLAEWDVVTGAGMSVSVSNSNLLVTTGTTINSTTTLVSKTSFTPPFNAAFGFKVSQKIVNNEFYVELVAENSDGTLDETTVAAWRIAGVDSTGATTAKYEVRNGGAARLQSANVSGVASQTADGFYEITIESDEVWFHSRAADSTAARATSYVRNTIAPDPNRRYRLRVRVVNGGVAPASSTTLTMSAVTVVDFTEIQTSIQGGTGSSGAAQAVPMYLVGGTVTSLSTSAVTVSAVATSVGSTPTKVMSAATTNATLVKATAGRIYGYRLMNTSASTKFFRIYNKATAPTVGTDSPVMVIPIPANSLAAAEFTVPVTPGTTGIGYSITGGSADLDATAVAAGDVVGTLEWI